jgi:hypothetical protein
MLSCHESHQKMEAAEVDTIVVPKSKADSIIKLSQKSHGVSAFEEKMFQFDFRNKAYSFWFSNQGFKFNRIDTVGQEIIHDNYSNEDFWREVNGESIPLTEEEASKYKASVNSVIYFASLPYKLSDAGVLASYKGQQTIKSKVYEVVEVRFGEEGGGEDYDDIFYYWINAESYLIDYLAYQYNTNGGGVRFRAAYNRQKVSGAVFQDYINYEVAIGTALEEIPALFEKDSLKELSRIENTNIVVIP